MGIEIYHDLNYFLGNPSGPEQAPWEAGQLRYGNQLAAIAYALGIYPFTRVQELIGFDGEGDKVMYGEGSGVHDQLKKLWEARKRTPTGILEIGGGRGEVSCATQTIGIHTQMVEPCRHVVKLVDMTVNKFGFKHPIFIHNYSFKDSILSIIDCWNTGYMFDTVMFIESIEHIEEEEFWNGYERIISLLKLVKGWMIITNWIWYHEIPCSPPWHCFGINDNVYDRIASFSKRTVYRDRSHIIFEY